MKITPTQTFLDDTDRFEPDQEYDVDEERGLRLVSLGFATSPDLPDNGGGWSEPVTVATPVELQPDAVHHDLASRVKDA